MMRENVIPLRVSPSRHNAAKFPVPMSHKFDVSNLEMTSRMFGSLLLDGVALEA